MLILYSVLTRDKRYACKILNFSSIKKKKEDNEKAKF